ncbi:hypothetical protein C823_001812 [Eubacterium plexicaudatum ASF492]|nr:hypothetical protein C823_001812 [Eubacterium plexicaudatum ASF492]
MDTRTQVRLCDSFYLPIYLVRRTYEEYEEVESVYTKKEAKQQAAQHLTEFLEKLTQKGVLILEKHVMIRTEKNKYTVSGTITVLENTFQYVKNAEKVTDTGDEGNVKMSLNEICMELPSDHMGNIFGQFDAYLKIIERSLQVSVICRDEQVRILGDPPHISSAKQVISQLLELSVRGSMITEQNVDYAIALVKEHETATLAEIDDSCVGYTVNGKPIRPKTLGQKNYVDLIKGRMIVFGTGPAGTGKTYLAMAMAVASFKKKKPGGLY